MPRWTRKAALERMHNNEQLQKIYEQHPLIKLLVNSATNVRRHPGYCRIDFYYAYKDWMRAITLHENEAYWIVIQTIADLLPPDDADLNNEDGSSIYTGNPTLPGLPPLPERPSKETIRFITIDELEDIASEGKERHRIMRGLLEEAMKEKGRKTHGRDD